MTPGKMVTSNTILISFGPQTTIPVFIPSHMFAGNRVFTRFHIKSAWVTCPPRTPSSSLRGMEKKGAPTGRNRETNEGTRSIMARSWNEGRVGGWNRGTERDKKLDKNVRRGSVCAHD